MSNCKKCGKLQTRLKKGSLCNGCFANNKLNTSLYPVNYELNVVDSSLQNMSKNANINYSNNIAPHLYSNSNTRFYFYKHQ